MYDLTAVVDTLDLIDGKPLFKNSLSYESADWREFEQCEVSPVQRKLTARECVFDLDDVAPMHFDAIPEFLKMSGLKFIAWKSGPTGMHIHFWVNAVGKNTKKAIVRYLATSLEKTFGVKNDLGPMGHECIRTEFSNHPAKGYAKEFLTSNLSTLFPLNDVDLSEIQKVSGMSLLDTQMKPNSSSRDGKRPTCIKYIHSHKFSDGRDRLVFVLVSWYKAEGLAEKEIFQKVYDWCREQGYGMSPRHIYAKIKANAGTVGCRYRHELLEELGVDMTGCKYE